MKIREETARKSGGIEKSHPYPCRFPPATPKPFLPTQGVILDPFCGSGTTLVEAGLSLSAERIIGFDCNPIAVLISEYMCLPNEPAFLARCSFLLNALRDDDLLQLAQGLDLPDFPGRDHWFHPQVRAELAAIVAWIDSRASGEDERVWLHCSLSAIVTRVSYQDSDTRYRRVPREIPEGAAVSGFVDKAAELLQRLEDRGPLSPRPEITLHNVMEGFPLPDGSVDAIVTSPPYANTMDYYLYHKQRMNVLGFDFKAAQAAEIGSRYEYSSRKRTREKWGADLAFVLGEMYRVLTPRGKATLVMGDSQIAGTRVDASRLISQLALDLGLHPELLESVPMSKRSRAFNASFQRPGKYEHIITLTKT